MGSENGIKGDGDMSIEYFLLGFIALSFIIGFSRIAYLCRETSRAIKNQENQLFEIDKQIANIHKRTMRNIELIKYAQEFQDEFQEYIQLLDSELNLIGIDTADD